MTSTAKLIADYIDYVNKIVSSNIDELQKNLDTVKRNVLSSGDRTTNCDAVDAVYELHIEIEKELAKIQDWQDKIRDVESELTERLRIMEPNTTIVYVHRIPAQKEKTYRISLDKNNEAKIEG